MQTTKVYTADGSTKIFQSDRSGPKSSYYLAVFLGDSTDAVALDDYSIINNAVVFNTAPADTTTVTVQTSTTDETALQSPFDVSTVAGSIEDVQSVAANMTVITNAATHAVNASGYADDAAASATATGLDRIATAADVVLTNADVVLAEADKVQTGLDRVATTADVVSTNADVVTTTSNVTAAQTAQQAAEDALDAFEDTYLGAKASDPSLDNDGNALVAGTWYFNTDADQARIYDGTNWAYLTVNTTNFATQSGSTGALHLPAGSTSQQPSAPSEGDLRWNTDTPAQSEIYNGTSWENFAGSGDDNVQSDWSVGSGDAHILNKPGNANAYNGGDGFMSWEDKSKLDGVEALAEANNFTDTQQANLTGAGNSTLHYHGTDRDRANHTGSQVLETISDVTATATEVNYTDGVTSNIQTQLNAKSASTHNHEHDSLTGYSANRHIDWTAQSAGTIHTSNFEDIDTTYTPGTNISIDANDNNKISTSADANVKSNWNEDDQTEDSFIQNKPNVAVLGETQFTAYRGDRGKQAWEHATATTHAEAGAEVNRDMDAVPTDDSVNNSVSSNGVFDALAGKAASTHTHSGYDNPTMDAVPTNDNTTNTVSSDGVFDALSGKADSHTNIGLLVEATSPEFTDTTYTAGTGIDIVGTNNTLSIDLSEISTDNAVGDFYLTTNSSGGQFRMPKASIDVTDFNTTNFSVALSNVGGAGALAALGTVGTSQIDNGSVTVDKLDANSVSTVKIVADAITADKMADASVLTGALGDSNVTTAKLANLSVTTGKIANDAITGAKVANDAIDSEHIAADSIDSEHYSENSIGSSALADGAVGIAILSATGTKDATTFLRGDNTWQVVTSGGGGADSRIPSSVTNANFLRFNGTDGTIEQRTAAEVMTQLGAGTSNLELGNTSSTALAGDTTTITTAQAAAIVANTNKTGITSAQASAIVANTNKTGITTAQAAAIVANTNKTGITSAQASAITANSDKVTNATHTGDVTGTTALTIAENAVTLAKMAHGTDGELITYDASGAPTTVAVGEAEQVLTSNGPGAAPTFQAAGGGGGGVEAGTKMLFWQAAAPTDWTQITTHNNKGLRVVSGTGGGSGPASDGTDWTSPAGGAHTLSLGEMPQHSHGQRGYTSGDPYGPWNNSSTKADTGSSVRNFSQATTTAGSSDPHSHSVKVLKYVDVIICEKD